MHLKSHKNTAFSLLYSQRDINIEEGIIKPN